MAGRVAELLCGIMDTNRLSLQSRSVTAVSAVSSGGILAVNFASSSGTVLWRSRVIRSSPSAQPWRGRMNVTTAGAGEENEGSSKRDGEFMLKKKAADVAPHLSGSSIFLVGMSRSGKTTVGKHLSQALGYYFFDSKELVQEAAGGIVNEMIDEEFQDAETEVLMQLSPLVRLVVATGEGAVVRPRNWGYLRTGITVWLDVPVDSLAKRIADSESALEEVKEDTGKILRERAEYYANADAIVSIEKIAAKKNIDDFSAITPPMVAFHVLEEIYNVLKKAEKSRN